MNVLSLFDGCSGGQQALERAGIKYNKYYASEIDKFAIQVTQHNYPDTIQLGSVVNVDVTKLEPIDLLIGGSPCTNFSFAGKRNGMTTSCNEEIYTLERYLELKADGFQFEGESYLFWEYMRILTDIRKYNPDVLFLLENVEMGAKWEKVLSEAIGIYGVHINSALVSAQNRKRIYWTNIRVKEVGLFGELHSDIPQPEDRGILLKDILEDEVDEKYYLSSKMLNSLSSTNSAWGERFEPMDKNTCKSKTLTARYFKMGKTDPYIDETVCVAMRGRGENNEQTLEPQLSGKTNTLTSVQKDNLVMQLKQINNRVDDVSFNDEGIRPFRNDAKKSGIQELGTIGMENTKSSCVTSVHSPKILIPEVTSKGYVEIEPGECFDAENINSKTRRGRKMVDKSNCLMAKETDFMRYEGSLTPDQLAKFNPDVDASKHNALTQAIGRGGSSSEYMDSVSKVTNMSSRIRRLTPLEAERLQTMKDNYTAVVSDSQRYKMIGNGWTIDVIAHIFSFINDGKTR
jgi:DNA-cytosine methyltransferase